MEFMDYCNNKLINYIYVVQTIHPTLYGPNKHDDLLFNP